MYKKRRKTKKQKAAQKRMFIIVAVCLDVVWLVFTGAFMVRHFFQQSTHISMSVLQERIREKREQTLDIATASSTEFEPVSQNEINVLLLGLDSRYTTTSTRCDAIHMFTLDIEKKTIRITSVPRGTHIFIPGNFSKEQQYISNACSLVNHEYAIGEIEKMVEKNADYVVKVDFSRTLGILRSLQLPTNDSLQWLRNRKGFGIGDPQRSHNQALFMKDVTIKKIALFKNVLMLPVAKVVYSYTQTDMDFPSFYTLLKDFAESGLDEHPERIELDMRPRHIVKDYHFDFANPDKFNKRFPVIVTSSTLDITSSTSSTIPDAPPRTLASIQNELIRFMTRRLSMQQSVEDIIEKKLWLQIEKETVREDLHFKLVEKYVQELSDVQKQKEFINEYIQEEKAYDLDEWAKKGKELMKRVVFSSSTVF